MYQFWLGDILLPITPEKVTIACGTKNTLFDCVNGNVVMWQIRHITTEENEDIRQECMEEKGGKYRLNVNKYLSKITAMSVVYPNLYDADLQDSYGKKTPESLLKAIVDCPGEYDSLVSFVQDINGFTSLREDIEKAKK